MKKKFLYILICFFFASIACNNTNKKSDKSDFQNEYIISPEKCKSIGMPDVSFKISYPDDVLVFIPEENKKATNYIEFAVRNGKEFLEGLTIGYFNGAGNATDDLIKSLLNKIIGQYQAQIPGVELVYSGKKEFNNKKVYQAHLKFEITNEKYGDLGKYKILLALLPPDNQQNNGVLIIFQATEKSKINDFNDFGKKGKLAEVWKTFKFI